MLNTPFFALVKKEFFSIWRDKKSRSVILLPPILQLFIFSHAATLDITNIKIGILDKDNTEITREFIRQIKTSRYFNKIYHFQNPKDMKNAVDEEKIRAGVYINNDFTKKYKKENNPEIFVVSDGRRTNSSQIITGYITDIANSFSPMGKTKTPSPVEFELRNRYNHNLSYHFFIVSSLMGILPMTTVLLLSALALAREKEGGTFEELMIVPLSENQIAFGKLVVPLFFGVLNGCIILLLSKIFFSLPFCGSFLLYILSLTVFLSCISGIGLFISAYCKSQQQAMLLVFAFMMPAIILSGYTSPIENISPSWLRHLTVLNPLRFFLVISKGIILKNINFYVVLLNLIPILILAMLSIIGSSKAFKRKIE